MPRMYCPNVPDASTVAARSQEVALRDRDLPHEAVGGGIAAHDREIAGRLLFDVDVDHHPVGRRTGLVGDLHGLEEIQTLDAPLGAIDQGAIVGIAFRNIELAPDHVVARARIAADVDALDIGPDALIDDEGDADEVVLRVAIAPRTDRRKRISVLGDLDGDVFDRLLN